MLQSRNLDDQSFEQIMEYVLGRLPWLCPAWTDYNAHDPGITILELMAWYKEMQQYHLNTVTDELRTKLLKLLGVKPLPPRPAHCYIGLPESAGEYPSFSRLDCAQDIPFELTQSARGGQSVQALYIVSGENVVDMTQTVAQPGISIWPFDHEGGKTELLIGFVGARDSIRLWFDIDDACEVARNPFIDAAQAPRVLEWSAAGGGALDVLDETHALSHSGYITFASRDGFAQADGGLGLAKRCYIRVRQTDAGCEERVRLSGVSAGRYPVVQRETWAKYEERTVAPDEVKVTLCDALSREGEVLAFLREDAGLRPVECARQTDGEGVSLSFDAAGAAQDGAANLILISLDPVHCTQLLFPSTGLPNMELNLSLGGRQVLTDSLTLICDTRCEDGVVRPALWRYVEDLSCCGPRDRAFTYDPLREQIIFGDGAYGEIVPRGERGVLTASFMVSYCEGGNIPAESGLTFSDGEAVSNTAASGGADAQGVSDAAREFLRSMEHPGKCASERDYERAALATPGLRVAAAKAIAGFDPDEPAGKSRIPVVTVVALPYSSEPQPMPDARFLNAIRAYLETKRPVCTMLKVIAPSYVPVGLSALVRASRDVQGDIRIMVEEYLRVDGGRSIGDPVVRDDLMVRLMQLDGVLGVERLELRPLSADCAVSPNGDLLLKRNAMACLRSLHVQVR